MKTYLFRRLLQSLLVLLGVSFAVFLILHLTGDPPLLLLPPDATAEEIQQFRQAMGFNDPVLVQYLRFLQGAAQGNFGVSLRHGEPAFALVVERLPATLELAGAALPVAVCLAIPAGIISAVKRNFGPVQPLSLLGPGRSGAPRAARNHARALHHRANHPADTLGNARGAGAGLYPHGPRHPASPFW